MNGNQHLIERSYQQAHQYRSKDQAQESRQRGTVEIRFRDQKGAYKMRFDLGDDDGYRG